MARPKIEIDFKIVKRLCGIQCTGEEIASVLQIDYDTLNARIKEEYKVGFSEYYKKESAVGKISLRRLQWKAADRGNVSMLIWLGKQYLGQTDKQEFSGIEPIKLVIEHVGKRKKDTSNINL